MRHLLVCAAILGLSLTTAGCEWYFGNDDDCNYNDGAFAEPDQAGFRNPQSGQCEYWGGGGGGGCGDYFAVGLQAAPDWAMCFSQCTGLDEQSCMDTSGCRAVYRGNCPEGLDCGVLEEWTYAECWATAPSGPVQGGVCEGLDAYECSRHDDCVARHYPNGAGCNGTEADCAPGTGLYDPTGVGAFNSCASENQATGCYGDDECGEGERCNASEVCLPPPTDADCDPSFPDCGGNVPTACYGHCVPDDIDKGTCVGMVACDSIPPKCPADSVPGILNGCWSGYCIPLSECETTATCDEVTNEFSCISRADCSPIYEGINCTCDGDGTGGDGESFVPCTCESWEFKSCDSAQP